MLRGLNHIRNSFNFSYSKAMYEAWKNNPSNVHEDWDLVFKSVNH